MILEKYQHLFSKTRSYKKKHFHLINETLKKYNNTTLGIRPVRPVPTACYPYRQEAVKITFGRSGIFHIFTAINLNTTS